MNVAVLNCKFYALMFVLLIVSSGHAMLTQLFSGRFVPGQTTLTRGIA